MNETVIKQGLIISGSTAASGSLTTTGNVGIGTTSPDLKLHLAHSDTNNGLLLEHTSQASSYGILQNIRQNEGLIWQRWINGVFNSNLMTLSYDGNVGIGTTSPTTRLHVKGSGATSLTFTAKFQDSNSADVFTIQDNGDVKASGDITAFYSSDENLKANIQPITNPIDKINQIGGYEFDWKPESSHTGHDVGVIAQEIETIIPEVVTTRTNGYKAVRYEKIVPLLIEAIKEQQKQIDELKALLK